jgi:predicted RND superfamily exporter protein
MMDLFLNVALAIVMVLGILLVLAVVILMYRSLWKLWKG